jgi:NAD(P)-dependent dehydrogenase (short-subunit alcohol dehydrogenase family)
LTGKVALFTGATRGLGHAMALGFAAAGADIVVTSRKADACTATAEEITRATGRRAVALPAHMGGWQAATDLFRAAAERVGRIDVLVNNAGIAPTYPSLPDVTEDLFDKTFAVNVKGPFRLTALMGAAMVEWGGGSIINVSSVSAIRPKPTDLVYAAAKAGLDVLTIGFAKAFAPSVRVNTLMAGPFLTDIAKAWDMDVVGPRLRSYPLGRAGEPHEIVGAAIHLASDASSFTTGAVLRVDGGMGIA